VLLIPIAASRLRRQDRSMGSGRGPHETPDLFSTSSVAETSAPETKHVSPVQQQRHVLPQNLSNAVKHLDDRELDRLIAACVEEAKRRGRLPASNETTKRSSRVDNSSLPPKGEIATVSLTRGQVNAVRAAFKAGITLTTQPIQARSDQILVLRGKSERVNAPRRCHKDAHSSNSERGRRGERRQGRGGICAPIPFAEKGSVDPGLVLPDRDQGLSPGG
jgi:hypothetical protein